jgi:endothelin-converting enzyme
MKVVSIMLKEVDVENHSQLARAVRSKPRSHAKLAAHHLDNGDDYVVPEVTPTVFEEGSGVPAFVEQDEDNSWPPWPWPPWSGDEDDGDDDDKKTPVDFAKLAKGVVALEKQIANASLDLDILQQDPWATYNPAPIANLTSALPAIRFSDYFAAFTPRNFPERVIVSHPPYVAALAEILNYTRADVLEAYLVSRAALALAPYLGRASEAWQAQRALVEALSGIKPGAVGDRSEFCVGRIEGTLGFAAGRYFANLTFGEDARAAGTKVITDIVTAFKHSLGRLDWMDAESAARAAQKADKLDVKVGYPLSPDTRDARALAGYYYLVKIDEKDFLGNVLSGRKSDVYKTWQKLGKRRNKQEWLMYPSQVNAYYNPPGNEVGAAWWFGVGADADECADRVPGRHPPVAILRAELVRRSLDSVVHTADHM